VSAGGGAARTKIVWPQTRHLYVYACRSLTAWVVE
jgi:hypothetical protein